MKWVALIAVIALGVIALALLIQIDASSMQTLPTLYPTPYQIKIHVTATLSSAEAGATLEAYSQGVRNTWDRTIKVIGDSIPDGTYHCAYQLSDTYTVPILNQLTAYSCVPYN